MLYSPIKKVYTGPELFIMSLQASLKGMQANPIVDKLGYFKTYVRYELSHKHYLAVFIALFSQNFLGTESRIYTSQEELLELKRFAQECFRTLCSELNLDKAKQEILNQILKESQSLRNLSMVINAQLERIFRVFKTIAVMSHLEPVPVFLSFPAPDNYAPDKRLIIFSPLNIYVQHPLLIDCLKSWKVLPDTFSQQPHSALNLIVRSALIAKIEELSLKDPLDPKLCYLHQQVLKNDLREMEFRLLKHERQLMSGFYSNSRNYHQNSDLIKKEIELLSKSSMIPIMIKILRNGPLAVEAEISSWLNSTSDAVTENIKTWLIRIKAAATNPQLEPQAQITPSFFQPPRVEASATIAVEAGSKRQAELPLEPLTPVTRPRIAEAEAAAAIDEDTGIENVDDFLERAEGCARFLA